MSETVVDPERIQTVVESGETEAVNDLIDELEGLDVDDQVETFETVYDTLLDCMNLDDGYSRQAVVRIVAALDPATARLATQSAPDRFDTVPADERFDAAIEHAAALFVAALTDPDGRIRRAAIRGIKSLCVGCRLTGDQATIEQLIADIEALSPDEECEEHVAEARDTALGQLH